MKYKINVLEDYIQLETNPIIKTEHYIEVEANSYEEAKKLAYEECYKQCFKKFKEIGFTQLNKIGVNLKNDKGNYRSLSDILEDISKKFNENIKNDELEGENKMNKFNIGDKVKLIEGLDDNIGISQKKLNELYSKEYLTIIKIEYDEDEKQYSYKVIEGYWFLEDELIKVIENKMKMRIKYFEGATKLQKIQKGNWIDVYANKDVFVPVGERAMIPLGFALELPQGWEGHLAPRSSTFKTWGIIQTNHVGVVDDTYIGDNDQWHIPIYCLQGKEYEYSEDKIIERLGVNAIVDCKPNEKVYTSMSLDNSVKTHLINKYGTWIRKGDKIGQFRIMEVMPEIEFEEVETFGNANRGGFGTTGTV